jgi:hypothetical protein
MFHGSQPDISSTRDTGLYVKSKIRVSISKKGLIIQIKLAHTVTFLGVTCILEVLISILAGILKILTFLSPCYKISRWHLELAKRGPLLTTPFLTHHSLIILLYYAKHQSFSNSVPRTFAKRAERFCIAEWLHTFKNKN